jgi:Transposase
MCRPVIPPRPVPTSALTVEGEGRMTMLAEVVDAVIGIDTHRDSHEVEIADPAGRPIAVLRIGNDSAGFAQLLAAIAEVTPGSRVAVSIEGTRSYGIGLARALAAAGLLVIECEQPSRRQRRGKGKSDPIDAHLAVLAALRLDATRLPVPRADGDREALRILLVARQEITVATTAQTSRLRALLLAGDDTDRHAARTTLTGKALAALAGRQHGPADGTRPGDGPASWEKKGDEQTPTPGAAPGLATPAEPIGKNSGRKAELSTCRPPPCPKLPCPHEPGMAG